MESTFDVTVVISISVPSLEVFVVVACQERMAEYLSVFKVNISLISFVIPSCEDKFINSPAHRGLSYIMAV